MTIVTRFAPSPTGYLHIGGARTALFNWLYAKRMGGKFLLRIEDTDKERNTPEAVSAIHAGMAWLGLNADAHPKYQSANKDRHVEVAMELLNRQAAYYDDGAIRVKGIKGSQTIDDLVQGKVTWPQDIDDFIILRKDGTPTYMLAVVVDDHDMGVTHVIRGDDHLNNAFRQMSIYRAMGWPIPAYGHIPLIMDENGKKLSKRTGAAAITDYQDMGILPNAMLNYLARLGWGHGNDEIFSMDQAIEWFDIKDVGRNPARLDKKKLSHINGHYIRHTSSSVLAKKILPNLNKRGVKPQSFDMVVEAVDCLKERSSDMNALVDGMMFLWTKSPIELSEPLSDEDKLVLIRVRESLEQAEWNHDGVMNALNGAAEGLGIKLGKAIAPLRMALTGSKTSPPIWDCLRLLGISESNDRIREALK
jgi:glutamyl-tRNA synthetase